MSFANVLFDLDGTLTDPKPGITRSIRFALQQLAVEAPSEDALEWCIGPPLKESFEVLLESSEPALIQQAIHFYRERFSEVGITENILYPDIPELLNRLKGAGYRIFLATSKPRIFAVRILDYFALSPYFDAVYGSELDGTRSDKTDLIRFILQVESLNPEETLIIGDRKHDILGGRANGISTGAVTYGYGSSEELQSANPDVFFAEPSAILDYLDKIRLPRAGRGMWANRQDILFCRDNFSRF